MNMSNSSGSNSQPASIPDTGADVEVPIVLPPVTDEEDYPLDRCVYGVKRHLVQLMAWERSATLFGQ